MGAPRTAGPVVRELMAEPRVGRQEPAQDNRAPPIWIICSTEMLLTTHSRSGDRIRRSIISQKAFILHFDLKFNRMLQKCIFNSIFFTKKGLACFLSSSFVLLKASLTSKITFGRSRLSPFPPRVPTESDLWRSFDGTNLRSE